VHRDALVHRLNLSMASHKSELRAVLLIELITSAVLSLHQRTLIVCSGTAMLTVVTYCHLMIVTVVILY